MTTAKRMRQAEPLEIPGSFPGRSKVHRRSIDDRHASGRDSEDSDSVDRSSEGGEWLRSLIFTPIRLAASWLAGHHGLQPPATPTPAQKNPMARHPARRTHTQSRVQQANGVHDGLRQHRQQRQGTPVRTPGSVSRSGQRRPLMASSARHDPRRSRTIGLVRQYTMRPVAAVEWPRKAWRESPSAATSTAAYDSTMALSQLGDTQSILSVDSSLGLRGETPLWQDSQTLSPTAGRGSAAKETGSADAWLAQLRRKIQDALAVSRPTAAVATSAYDRLRQEGERLDQRLDKAQRKAAFTLPADAPAVLKKAAAAGFTAEVNNVPVTAHDMATLQDGKWLNDEVINFYMQLIMERSATVAGLPTVHAFNTFFYSTLRESGYARVRRWTRRTRLFEKDLVIVPVHLGVHWCCAVIDMRCKSITYYDALLGDNPDCLHALLDYLCEESRDKCATELDESQWTLCCDKQIPRQKNGYDCGVFAIMFAEHVARDAPFRFAQENCPFLRRQVTYEIATRSLTATGTA